MFICMTCKYASVKAKILYANVFYKKDTMHEVAFNVMSKARCEVKIYPGPIESLNTCRKNPPGGISMQNEKFDDNLKTTVK